jgi:hypothetical protein
MADELADTGISLWDDQGDPLTARQLIQSLLYESVDLDAPVLVGMLSPAGEVEIVRPVELATEPEARGMVVWVYERAREPGKPGMTFIL